MIISTDAQFEHLKAIGRICALTRDAAAAPLQPRMTTLELDEIVRRLLTEHDAWSAPKLTCKFPGAICISVNEEIAYGIPGDRIFSAGDLVNIDVSAEKDWIFTDTSVSFIIPSENTRLAKLCRDGKRAIWAGIRTVKAGAPLSDIDEAIGKFAKKGGYTLIQNMAKLRDWRQPA